MADKVDKVSRSEISNEQIAEIWDELCKTRFSQIENKIDISYWNVLIPVILKLSSFSLDDLVLDVGCGTGHLTYLVAENVQHVIGIDLSPKMVDIAQQNFSRPNLQFQKIDLHSFAIACSAEKYGCIIANMSLMDIKDLSSSLNLIHKLLIPQGRFVFTITHPCFWPIYKDYWRLENFIYEEEQAILQTFTITNDRESTYQSILFHRPLQKYISELQSAGFEIAAIEEPLPPPSILEKYSHEWKYPHFLAVCCKKLQP